MERRHLSWLRGDRLGATRTLLERPIDADLAVPVHCLGELFRVLAAKGRPPAPLLERTAAAWRGAMDLCVPHQLASWDALVLNVAAQGGGWLLLSEDLQPGLSSEA